MALASTLPPEIELGSKRLRLASVDNRRSAREVDVLVCTYVRMCVLRENTRRTYEATKRRNS